MRPGMILGVARAEARLARRLVRYWLFVALASLIGLAFYGYYAFLHWNFSGYSATVATINPRYLTAVVGMYYTMIFLFGLIFLGFDVRARDRRERMAEVLDSRPCSNVELLFGRFLGLLVVSWIPVLVISVIILVLGWALREPVDPRGVIGYVGPGVLPAFAFTIGLVFFVSLLVRHRLAAALLLLAAIGGLYFLIFKTPLYLHPFVGILGGYALPFPSDLAPQIIDGEGVWQRTGVFLEGLGLVFLAAAIHPRLDQGSRAVRAAIGLGILLAGVAACGAAVLSRNGLLEQREAWRETHAELSEAAAPDLERLSGRVSMRPGRELRLELELRFRAPREAPLSEAVFSLNPGMRVESLRTADGSEIAFEQGEGLIRIPLDPPLDAGAERTLRLEARGRPLAGFAYLDAVKDPLSIDPTEGQIYLLGYESHVFRRGYVALVPGVRWLPASGPEIGRADPEVRPVDFFDVDLTVEVPEGWLVAGPGRRQEAEAESGGDAYRFAPPAPVPDVALVASRFERRSTVIDDVELEILVHPSHPQNLEFFEDAAGEIREWLMQRMEEAESVGLGYPYDGLSLVEVPTILRGYGGGWRMDTTLEQPAMILMRESGFSTARFDRLFNEPEEFRDREGGIARAKREALERFFENDFSGGNPFLAASRSFFSSQTAGAGDEGLPLDYVCETLSTRLVSEKQGYFSVHIFDADMNETVGRSIGTFFSQRGRGQSFADAVIETVTSRVSVWDRVLEVSLEDLDPWEDPQETIDVLTLKGGAMARSMLDDLGRERTGRLLGDLRERNQGEPFGREDMVAAGETIGAEMGPWLDTWIEETALPGFTAGATSLERLPDDEDGSPRYQLLATVRNEEETPGLLRLDYRLGERGGGRWDRTEPVRVGGVSAVEVGVVASSPPELVRVVPYLALNREPFALQLPAVDEDRIVEREPFVGARQVDWEPPETERVVVDDLDEGFRVEEPEDRPLFRFGGRDEDVATDAGLPVMSFGRAPTRWSRISRADAWGKYRHTAAVIRAGEGRSKAIFQAELPSSGTWRLEYHLPRADRGRRRGRLGTFDLAVRDASTRHDVELDASGGEPGWNLLGTFDLSAGDVSVEVTDDTDGNVVVADAIRWTPERSGPGES